MQELKPIKEGKVREIYDNGDSLIMVATDRISCFDVILNNKVDKKGTVLTQMSKFWFDMTKDILPNHMISVDVKDMPEFFRQERFDGNSMLCKKLTMLPVECIVRGYITGSGWASYKENGTVCGIKLPEGLKESDKLPEPIYTPSTKAEIGDHDENISFEQSVEYLEKRFPGKGLEYGTKLRDYTIALYKKCAEYALTRGIIIADTKFEFGLDEDGNIVLGDEMLTPDSSRFWPAQGYEPGHGQPSFDKQFARDWLKANDNHNWTLPQDIVDKTIDKYLQSYELLTGKPLLYDVKDALEKGKTVLGIEFGSTRIKAVLIDEYNSPIASGSHDWENRYENGIWTYSLDDIWGGLQDAYTNLAKDVLDKYGVVLRKIGAIGFSAMMHGYMVFDEKDELLVPFRTWRNNITGPASEKLTELFGYHIPQRWSIAHLYQAILNKEEHVGKIHTLLTLAGYIHWKLTGRKVLGVGEASGMFPIDIETKDFNARMIRQFDELVAGEGYGWKLRDILPEVLVAGENAGTLTAEGAKLLDVSGNLEAGIPLCPPEGDAGTGMVATNSVAERTGNVSAGTSVFAMIVMEKELEKAYDAIDLVTTPTGSLVAMVHCNNCTSDLNAWVGLFKEFAESFGMKVDMNALFGTLYNKALEGDADCGGLLAYNYFSGEHITGFTEGRPMFVRTPESKFNLANFMRVHLFTSLGALKTGLDILFKEEGVQADRVTGHGGLFKTKGVGQSILAAAMNTPVSVMETAGEGGAWGIALLAAYMLNKKDGETLDAFLEERVFGGNTGVCIAPKAEDVAGFDEFIKRYAAGLPIEQAAVECLK